MKLPQEIIQAKRDGKRLSNDDIRQFVGGITDGSVTDAQISALAMAIFFQNMSAEEGVTLTTAMRDSGDVLNWNDLERPVVDKHSTGGVGDNVSLMLAPALAACGVHVPMISGRGLGHTGGTLDKFDSIPGYNTEPDNEIFRKVVREVGCAIIGQTGNLAPADKRFYSIRDVTATVESIPLITASILSKKLAAGLDALILDVKCGSGAFMETHERARALAENLVTVANGAGMKTSALITDMDRPLASCAGNAIEVKNAVQFLTGEKVDERLYKICVALGGQLLADAGVASDADEGAAKMRDAYSSGQAAEIFSKMVSALGGPSDFAENPDKYLEAAAIETDVFASGDMAQFEGNLGFDTRQLGLAVVELGGGRTDPSAAIDHSVGISEIAEMDWDASKPLCRIHARDHASAEQAEERIRQAVRPTTGNINPVLSVISS